MSVEVTDTMLTYYHTPPISNCYLRLFIGNLSIILILFLGMYSWSNTLDNERTEHHIPEQWIQLHLKPHKYNFVCKLPQTIISVKSKFRVLCKDITMLKFKLCHTGHKYYFGSSLSFFPSQSWNIT
jgi:hypothetical protein